MKSAKLMFLYAGFLALCGLIAFALAGFESRAKTALIIGLGTAAVMVICGLMARTIARNRGVGMIGVHGGLLLALVFGALFAWRSYKTFDSGGDDKRYLAIILAVMAGGSLIAFLAILSNRPAMADRTG